MRYCQLCRSPYGGDERFCPVDGGAIVAAEERSDPLVGEKLDGRYLVRTRLGQGGMGVVYRADHVALDKKVAIKFLLDKYTEDREVLARFHQEARTASRIGHENIIDIIDIGETDDGRSYIVMELLDGADLSRVLADSGRMHPERALRIIKQILRGLSAAHDKGIVHRDMKPENVFLANRGDRVDFVKIMDFGISKIIDAHDSKVRLTETGAVVGTPVYMAPEQARAEHTIDHRVDIYAVGVMLHEMLAGKPPFLATNYLELVTQHLFDPPPPLRALCPDLPAELEAVVLKALAKAPADRFGSAAEMAAALPDPEAFRGGAWDGLSTLGASVPELSSMRPAVAPALTAAPESGARKRSRVPVLIIGGAALAAVAMLLVTLMIAGNDRGDEKAEPAPAPAADRDPPVQLAPAVVEPLESVLEIESHPVGATVFINGDERGVTPLELRDLDPGTYTLRVEKAGYEPVETERTIEEGRTEALLVPLAPKGSDRESVVTRTSSRPSKRSSRRSATRAAKTAKPEPKPGKTEPIGDDPEPGTTRPDPVDPAPGKAEPPTKRKPNPYLDKKPNPYQ